MSTKLGRFSIAVLALICLGYLFPTPWPQDRQSAGNDQHARPWQDQHDHADQDHRAADECDKELFHTACSFIVSRCAIRRKTQSAAHLPRLMGNRSLTFRQTDFGLAWRKHFQDNGLRDYPCVQRGTGIGGSDENLEVPWFMNRLNQARTRPQDKPVRLAGLCQRSRTSSGGLSAQLRVTKLR